MAADQSAFLGIIILVMAMMAMMVVYASRYKKVPPDKAMVVYGRRTHSGGPGYRVVSGGGKFIMPVIESYELLDLSVQTIDLHLDDVRIASGEGASRPETIELRATALVKVSSDPSALKVAAEHLLHKTKAEIEHMGRNMIEGHIRTTLRRMSFDAVDVDRDEVATRIGVVASQDLMNVGLELRAITLNSVRSTE